MWAARAPSSVPTRLDSLHYIVRPLRKACGPTAATPRFGELIHTIDYNLAHGISIASRMFGNGAASRDGVENAIHSARIGWYSYGRGSGPQGDGVNGQWGRVIQRWLSVSSEMKKFLTISLLALSFATTFGTLPSPQTSVWAQKKNDEKPKKDQPGPPVVRDKRDKPPPPPPPRKKSS